MISKNTSINSVTNRDAEKEKRAVKTWILRVLITMDGCSKFLRKHGYESYQIARLLGLNDDDEDSYNPHNSLKKIARMHELENQHSDGLPRNTILSKNIAKLAKAFSLSTTEANILHFTIIVKTQSLMGDAVDLLGYSNPSVIPRLFARCLNIDANLVAQALSSDGTLIKTGLLTIEEGSYFCFESKVKTLDGLIENIDNPTIKPIEMFKSSFYLASKGKLDSKNYHHIKEDVNLLVDYLNSVKKSKKTGTNILIHGMPGVGKTEFVKMLAKHTKCNLYEIGFQGTLGQPLRSDERFKAYKVAQNLINSTNNNILLFDEVEDVFVTGQNQKDVVINKSGKKAWINKTLEENPVPAFWLTNQIITIDMAFIRRFDYVIEMKMPPKSVRLGMINEYTNGMNLSDSWKNQISKCEYLSPATIEQASSVIKAIASVNPLVDQEQSLHRVIGNSLEAMYIKRPLRKSQPFELEYQLDALNADCDIVEVSEGVASKGNARICLYGPPGTGKTAFGHYIAEKSSKPLLIKKASDILSPFIGECELNMARMFHEASEQNAVLLLDEADTYLQDRKKLTKTWEISGVNEMLTQIESFEGVFICSTNLMDSLDAAALRRFDLKIKFGYLNKTQIWQLFSNAIDVLSLTLDQDVKSAIGRLDLLVPGDFATVLRQSRFRPIKDSWDFYERLASECKIKPDSNKYAIGFH